MALTGGWQSLEWRAPAHFDEVLDVQICTKTIGTTSFCLLANVRRPADDALLVSAETIYVVYDEATASEAQVPDEHRDQLLSGAPGSLVDCSGAVRT